MNTTTTTNDHIDTDLANKIWVRGLRDYHKGVQRNNPPKVPEGHLKYWLDGWDYGDEDKDPPTISLGEVRSMMESKDVSRVIVFLDTVPWKVIG